MISLDDLAAPIGADRFIEDYFLPGQHFLSSPSDRLLSELLLFDELTDIQLLARRCERVSLFGPGGFRSVVTGDVAMDFYHRGDPLYMTNVHRLLPAVRSLFVPIAVSLGVHPAYCMLEVFAARRGAVSSMHYDNDTNFQILLGGSKTWSLERSEHIRNPLRAHHKLDCPREEVFADRVPVVAPADPAQMSRVTAGSGTSLFLTLGYWHHAEMLEDSIALNLVLSPPRWVDAVGAALRETLLAIPELRGPSFGALCATGSLQEAASRVLGCAVAAYPDALRRLRAENIALSVERATWRWSQACSMRELVECEDGVWLKCPDSAVPVLEIEREVVELLNRLVGVRGIFGIHDMHHLEPRLPLSALLSFASEMQQMGMFDVVDM